MLEVNFIQQEEWRLKMIKLKQYERMLELEKERANTLKKRLEFIHNPKNEGYENWRNEELFSKFHDIKEASVKAFKVWNTYKTYLERKHKFEFPISCYNSGSAALSFSQYLFDNFISKEEVA